MSKQFTAHVPARTIKGNGKTFSYPARDDVFTCDDDGQWHGKRMGEIVKMDDEDVISACKSASNWAEIRSIYFPMYGFHSSESIDKTPVNKLDY